MKCFHNSPHFPYIFARRELYLPAQVRSLVVLPENLVEFGINGLVLESREENPYTHVVLFFTV